MPNDEPIKRAEDYEHPTQDLERRQNFHDELLRLEWGIQAFLDGEINRGLITSYKLTVITTARMLRAVAMTARQDLIDNRVDLG